LQRYYFDHNATTPVDPQVLGVMMPALREVSGNASSIHSFGQDARLLVESARLQVADFLRCEPKEVVFASGGTESDNLAILGGVRAAAGDRKHVVTTTIEHPAVLATCRQLEREGVSVDYVAVGPSGVVDLAAVRAALRPETVLVSVMHANNELGTIQPVAEIAEAAHAVGALFHSDAVQSAGKLPIDVDALGVDLLTISGHKIYAPKGVGALYVRKGVEIESIQFGGRHEHARRPGTENVPGIVGLGAACELAAQRLAEESVRQAALRDRLERSILSQVANTWVNAAGSPRTPNTTNIGFGGIEGEPLLISLDLKGFAVSSGAACSSGAVEPSHVLLAIGLSREQARSCLRLSIGSGTAADDVDSFLAVLPGVVQRLRALAPAGR
jgi:cysteine desulfurase